MLLRLIPLSPLPTVLFTLTFPALPDSAGFPQAWALQIQNLLQNELEMPNFIHAFDKSVWAVSLLHEVTFSIQTMSVTCVFVDGARIGWYLGEEEFVKLHSVVEDVNEAAVASDMERERMKERERLAHSPQPSRAVSPARTTKHRKSRSLLMAIVA